MTTLTTLTYPISYPADTLRNMQTSQLTAASQVWMDHILGLMGETPADYSRFGWIAESRKTFEFVLFQGLKLAQAGALLQPGRLLSRPTRADIDTAITNHSMTASIDPVTNMVTINWTAEIKDIP